MSRKCAYPESNLNVAQRLFDGYSTVMSETSLANLLEDVSAYRHPMGSCRDAINQIILADYPNETTIKANFIDQVLISQNPSTVSIFELPIGSSRVDICKINGHSAAYEIKTDLDTFSRLEGQLHDYFDVFESVYVITSDSRWSDLPDYVPDECGIYSYRKRNDGSYCFCARRRATRSKAFDSEKQLYVMPKTAITSAFDVSAGKLSKNELIHLVLANYGMRAINAAFKKYLKERYEPNWSRFRALHPDIFEIDYEWFYRNGLDPSIIY